MTAMKKTDIEQLLANHTPTPKLPASLSNLWQPIVIYNRKVNIHDNFFKHHEESIPFVFYSDMVFTNAKEAEEFLPFYIKSLIENKDLPNDVVNEDKSVKDSMIKAAYIKLQIGQKVNDN